MTGRSKARVGSEAALKPLLLLLFFKFSIGASSGLAAPLLPLEQRYCPQILTPAIDRYSDSLGTDPSPTPPLAAELIGTAPVYQEELAQKLAKGLNAAAEVGRLNSRIRTLTEELLQQRSVLFDENGSYNPPSAATEDRILLLHQWIARDTDVMRTLAGHVFEARTALELKDVLVDFNQPIIASAGPGQPRTVLGEVDILTTHALIEVTVGAGPLKAAEKKKQLAKLFKYRRHVLRATTPPEQLPIIFLAPFIRNFSTMMEHLLEQGLRPGVDVHFAHTVDELKAIHRKLERGDALEN